MIEKEKNRNGKRINDGNPQNVNAFDCTLNFFPEMQAKLLAILRKHDICQVSNT